MSRKNKKPGVVAVALTAAVAIILVSSVAYGHWRSDNQDLGRIDLGQWNERVPSQYSMNPDQLVQTENVLFDCWEEMLPQQRKLSSLELEARLYSGSPDGDPDQVQSYGHQINDVQNEITALRQRANTRISKLLRNEQRSYFGTDFDWCDLGNNGGMVHGHDMGDWCRWDTYQQSERAYNGQDGCCW